MALLLKLTQKLALGFSALWARYPNKSAKKDAEKAFGQVVTTPAIEAEVHEALDWQIPHWQTLEWYSPPYLATYLRKGRYQDEKPPTTPNRGIAKAMPLTAKQLSEADRYRDQQRKTQEALRLMREEGLTREAAMARAFGPRAG